MNNFIPQKVKLYKRLTQSPWAYLNPVPGLEDALFCTAYMAGYVRSEEKGGDTQTLDLDGAPTITQNAKFWSNEKLLAAIRRAGKEEGLGGEQIDAVISAAQAVVPEKSDISITLPQGKAYAPTEKLLAACDPKKLADHGTPWILSGGVFLFNSDDRMVVNVRSGGGNEGQLQDFSGLLDGGSLERHMLRELNEELAVVLSGYGHDMLCRLGLFDEFGISVSDKALQQEKLQELYPNQTFNWLGEISNLNLELDERFKKVGCWVNLIADGAVREVFHAMVIEESQNQTTGLYTRTLAVRKALRVVTQDLYAARLFDPEWGERPVKILPAAEILQSDKVIPPLRAFASYAYQQGVSASPSKASGSAFPNDL